MGLVDEEFKRLQIGLGPHRSFHEDSTDRSPSDVNLSKAGVASELEAKHVHRPLGLPDSVRARNDDAEKQEGDNSSENRVEPDA